MQSLWHPRSGRLAVSVMAGLPVCQDFSDKPASRIGTGRLQEYAYMLICHLLATLTCCGSATAPGATSKAIGEKSSWATTRLSGAASLVALSVGLAVLASSLGVRLPFVGLLAH